MHSRPETREPEEGALSEHKGKREGSGSAHRSSGWIGTLSASRRRHDSGRYMKPGRSSCLVPLDASSWFTSSLPRLIRYWSREYWQRGGILFDGIVLPIQAASNLYIWLFNDWGSGHTQSCRQARPRIVLPSRTTDLFGRIIPQC